MAPQDLEKGTDGKGDWKRGLEKGTDLFILLSPPALFPIFDPPSNDRLYFANESFGSCQLPPLQRFAKLLPGWGLGQEIYRALLNAPEENRGTVLNTIRDVTEAELSHGDADAPSVAAASELALLWDEDQEWTRDIVPATDRPKVFDDAFRAKHGPLYDQLAHREASLAVFLSAHDPNWDDLKILQTHGLEPLLSTNWSSLFNLGRGTRVGNLLNIFSQQEDWTDRDLALVGEHLSRMPLP